MPNTREGTQHMVGVGAQLSGEAWKGSAHCYQRWVKMADSEDRHRAAPATQLRRVSQDW